MVDLSQEFTKDQYNMEHSSKPTWQEATPLSYPDKMQGLDKAVLQLKAKDITPQQALDRVLVVFNTLGDYGSNPRTNWLHDISLRLKTSNTIRTIQRGGDSELQAFTMPAEEYAQVLQDQAKLRTFETYNTIGYHENVLRDKGLHDAYLHDRKSHGENNAEFYRDHSDALFMLLFEEQWQQANTSLANTAEEIDHGNFPVDLETIEHIRAGQELFYQAHSPKFSSQKQELLEQARDKFAYADQALENKFGTTVATEADEQEKAPFKPHQAPISQAITKRLHAQSVWDLSEFADNPSDRKKSRQEAVDELAKAESAILSAIHTNHSGVQGLDILYGKIMYFQSEYRNTVRVEAEQEQEAIPLYHAIGKQALTDDEQPPTLQPAA